MQVAQRLSKGNGAAHPAIFPSGGHERLRDELAAGRLTWLPELGVGWYPVETGTEPYGQAYFDKLVGYSKTDLGRKIMKSRCALVDRHFLGTLIDVGSGCGAFIDERKYWRRTTYGFDVCPAALEWLEKRQLLIDPHMVPFGGASMWDVLEHMPDFRSLLANIREWLFLSIPIFRDAEHALKSKHFRPNEHFWYFTRDGLVNVLETLGFELVEENDDETKLGREDIMSFAFKRG